MENKNESNTMSKCNKNIKKKITAGIIIVVLTAIGIGGIAYAQMVKQHKDGGHIMMIVDKITDALNLTDSQKEQVKSIKAEIKVKMDSRKDIKHTGMDDFAAEFKKDNLDKTVLKEILKKQESEKEQMKDFMLDELVKFHKLLTPEQRSSAVSKMEEMKKLFKNRPESQ